MRLRLCLLIGVVGLSACAADGPARSIAGDAPADRLAAIGALDARVVSVFQRLIVANLEVCPDKGWTAGWMLHAANQYDGALRDVLTAQGLEGDRPAVSAVAPDGPAAKAGLSRGDVILAVDGVPLAAGSSTGPARYDGVKANLDRIDAAIARGGPVRLSVGGEWGAREVIVTPLAACDYDVHLDVSDELNARADGTSVHISSALASFAATPDDLAIVLGHELAHNVLEHREILDREAPARRVFGNLAVAPGRLEAAERDADRVGLQLMARAGFAYEVAPDFWLRFGQANWRVRWAQWGHPSAAARAEQLRAVVLEIQGTDRR